MSSDSPPFEVAFALLEDAVAVLEQGGLTLEEAVARFEVGMRLAARCEALLDAAELRITQLLEEHEDVEDEPAF